MKEQECQAPYEEMPIRCPRLGGPVTFGYCKIESMGRPCSKALDCWFAHFDVEAFFREVLSEEEFRECFARAPTPKMVTLIELIENARKAAEDAKTSKE